MHDNTHNHYTQTVMVDQLFYAVQHFTPMLSTGVRLWVKHTMHCLKRSGSRLPVRDPLVT